MHEDSLLMVRSWNNVDELMLAEPDAETDFIVYSSVKGNVRVVRILVDSFRKSISLMNC